MKAKYFNLIPIIILLGAFSVVTQAQQTIVEYNSNTTSFGPQLLLTEDGDGGSGAGQDGWSRLWFKNSSDATNRWGFLARPQTNATDNDGVLTSPLVMAYTGTQKFGFGSDGTLRINKQYTLPNMDGNNGDVLTSDGSGNVSWSAPSGTGGNTVTQVVQAIDLNPGADAADYVNLTVFSYFDSAPYNPALYYSLPIPEGGTLTKVSMIAKDNSTTKKLRMQLYSDTTNPGGIASVSLQANAYTTDTATSVFDKFDINVTNPIGPNEVTFLRLSPLENNNTATTWPGNDIGISKIVIEYSLP